MFNSRKDKDRQVLAAVREYMALNARAYTWVKLDQPIQRGWRRWHVLTEHAQARRDRPLLEAILAVIGTVVLSPRPDFLRRRGRARKLVEIEQRLRPIPLHEWERKSYPVTWRPYFRYELVLERNRHWQPCWVFHPESLFELKIARHWLWYFHEVDPTVETRLSELEGWLEARRGWQRWGWLKGRPQRFRWHERDSDKQRCLAREQQREIGRAIANFPEAEPAASTRRRPLSLRELLRPFPDVAQPAEALRSERSQYGCKSCRRDHFARLYPRRPHGT